MRSQWDAPPECQPDAAYAAEPPVQPAESSSPDAHAEPVPNPPKLVPRSQIQFVPKCDHRHALKRTTCALGSAVVDEPLFCDGPCGKEILSSDARWSCFPCDFDLCELCLLQRSGGAVYLGMLAAEERRADAATGRLAAALDRAKHAEDALSRRQKEEAKLEAKLGAKAAAAERRVAEERLAASAARVEELEASVAKLEEEVAQRRQRSKANLEKMYAARAERDAAIAAQAGKDGEWEATLAAAVQECGELRAQLDTARQQLAVAHGDPDALGRLSYEEVEQLEVHVCMCMCACVHVHVHQGSVRADMCTRRRCPHSVGGRQHGRYERHGHVGRPDGLTHEHGADVAARVVAPLGM